MKTRYIVAVLWAVAVAVLVHFVDVHFMLAGGGPCLIIIMDGNRAYGAIEAYHETGGTESTGMLAGEVLASCALTQYGSLYLQGEGNDLAGDVLGKIGHFHQKVINHIGSPEYDIPAETSKLHRLNNQLNELIVSLENN